jgi:hypothetical protein
MLRRKKPMGKKFLQKQREENQFFLEVGMDSGFQKCWDLLQIVLHDPEVMGKDTFGKERIKKIYWAMKELEKKLGRAWLPSLYNDADVCQRDLDALLNEIWKDELCPFYERYPHMKKPDYSKGRKEWR